MSSPWAGMTGNELLTDTAQRLLLTQKTPALFCCGDPDCIYFSLEWEATLPPAQRTTTGDWQWEKPRGWPKCPDGHRARFIEIVEAHADDS